MEMRLSSRNALQEMMRKSCSALWVRSTACTPVHFINTGMFIKTVPDSVIAFCEEKQLPLFALPWEVPLVDVTREYCQMIIDNAAQEDTVATIMKDLIFHVGEKDALLHSWRDLVL